VDDLLTLAVLAGFVLVSVLLIASGGTRLDRLWWVGSLASGLVVAGLALVLASALQGLDTGDSGPIPLRGWLAIGLAGALGFLGGTDVQVLVATVLRRSGGLPAVVAGAILGPILIVGGFWLLVRLNV
jgi:hypothetical protein